MDVLLMVSDMAGECDLVVGLLVLWKSGRRRWVKVRGEKERRVCPPFEESEPFFRRPASALESSPSST